MWLGLESALGSRAGIRHRIVLGLDSTVVWGWEGGSQSCLVFSGLRLGALEVCGMFVRKGRR